MKKVLGLLVILLISVIMTLTACTVEPESKVNIAILKGPTGLGALQIVDEATKGNNNYNVSIMGAVDEITPKLVKGELDIVAVPTNVASVLYSNTNKGVKAIVINTLGVLHIVTKNAEINSIQDLEGKTIISSGAGSSPEFVLKYILEQNNLLDKVTFEWKSEHAECVTALNSTDNAVALLPEPFVSSAIMKNSQMKVALSLNDEWAKTQEGKENPSAMIMGVFIARTEFIENNKQAVLDFISDYTRSVEYVNANVEEASVLSGTYNIIPQPVAAKAIPNCNLTSISGNEMINNLKGYLNVLFDFQPKSVGGSLPENDFYFVG